MKESFFVFLTITQSTTLQLFPWHLACIFCFLPRWSRRWKHHEIQRIHHWRKDTWQTKVIKVILKSMYLHICKFQPVFAEMFQDVEALTWGRLRFKFYVIQENFLNWHWNKNSDHISNIITSEIDSNKNLIQLTQVLIKANS